MTPDVPRAQSVAWTLEHELAIEELAAQRPVKEQLEAAQRPVGYQPQPAEGYVFRAFEPSLSSSAVPAVPAVSSAAPAFPAVSAVSAVPLSPAVPLFPAAPSTANFQPAASSMIVDLTDDDSVYGTPSAVFAASTAQLVDTTHYINNNIAANNQAGAVMGYRADNTVDPILLFGTGAQAGVVGTEGQTYFIPAASGPYINTTGVASLHDESGSGSGSGPAEANSSSLDLASDNMAMWGDEDWATFLAGQNQDLGDNAAGLDQDEYPELWAWGLEQQQQPGAEQ
jgi:hypothetical protein